MIPFLRKHLEHLSVAIGERHLGSSGEVAAQHYLAEQFRAYGYEVAQEAFDTPGWRFRSHQLNTSDGETIDSAACFFSPGGTVSAPLHLYTAGRSTPDQFAGKIAFAGNYDFQAVSDTNELAEQLEEAGALAFIINSPYNDTYSTKVVRSPKLKRMPVVTLSQRAALRLAREEGRIVHLSVDAETFPHQSANVVARYRPAISAGRKLIIGAHYDTAPGIPGAVDNASGIAVLLHLAKALRAQLADWEVDFVAFGGEEYGGPGYGIGGYAYYHQHATEPIRAMICIDGVGSYLAQQEIRVGRSRSLKRIAAITAKETTTSQAIISPFKRGSDQGIFDLHDIPTAWFCESGPSNGVRHFPLHSPQDTLDVIDFPKLAAVAEDATRFLTRVLHEDLIETAPEGELTPLVKEDHPQVITLARAVWTMGMDARREQHYGRHSAPPWADKIAASIQDYLSRSDVFGFKITVAGCFAGFLTYRITEPPRFGEVGYNAVSPEFAGRGYGQWLLRAALDAMKEAGLQHAEVVTGLDPGHAPARAVYEAAGFRPLHTSILYTLPLSKSTGKEP